MTREDAVRVVCEALSIPPAAVVIADEAGELLVCCEEGAQLLTGVRFDGHTTQIFPGPKLDERRFRDLFPAEEFRMRLPVSVCWSALLLGPEDFAAVDAAFRLGGLAAVNALGHAGFSHGQRGRIVGGA